MSSPFIDSRWRAHLAIFIVVGWVSALINLLVSAALLVLAPPDGEQSLLLKLIGAMLLVLVAAQSVVNTGMARRAEWARRAGWVLALIEILLPPFGTLHALMAFALLRRPSALQWFV